MKSLEAPYSWVVIHRMKMMGVTTRKARLQSGQDFCRRKTVTETSAVAAATTQAQQK